LFFKIGKYTYGFQGHPEVKPELLKVWCQAGWGSMYQRAGKMVQETVAYVDKNFERISMAGDFILNMWVDITFESRVPAAEKNEDFQFYLQHVLIPAAHRSRRQSRQSISLSLSAFGADALSPGDRKYEQGDSDSEIDHDAVEKNQRKLFEEMIMN